MKSTMKPITVSFTTRELATRLEAKIFGNPDLVVKTLCPLSKPIAEALTFYKGKSRIAALRSLNKLPEIAVLVDSELLPDEQSLMALPCTVLAVPNAQRSFIDAIDYFYEAEPSSRKIHPTAQIDPSASISEDVSVGPFCVIGPRAFIAAGVVLDNSVTLYPDTSVGARTRLYSGVTVREGCTLGADCTVHNNTVIGADGFGYIHDPKLGIRKVPQVGTVVIGDSVEIGANTSIDRATIGSTVIGSHTKIDNQVQIGHNVTIGTHCLVCAQVGVAGSAMIGDGVVLGGGTGVADHITIVSGVRVGGHSGVTTDISEPGDYMGMPAIKAGTYRRQQASVKRLVQTSSPASKFSKN